MSLSNVQTQTAIAHLGALRKSLTAQKSTGVKPVAQHAEILASFVHELGPFMVNPMAEAITTSRHTLNDCCPDDIDCICVLLDKLVDFMENALETNTPPDRGFRDLIAQLLEKIGPFLIEALIIFLLAPTPPVRNEYCNLN